MRSSADGKGPGLGFLILGGEHGDLPLEAGAGELVAKLVVEERVSVILDLSTFRKHEVATFMTAFAENLYRLKAREQYRTPVMVVVDEADAVAPQKPQRGEERMLGAIEDWVRRGRQRGLGCTLVTQRSAVLNKNVLTQAQVMIAMRTIAPQDLAAMDAWIEVHGTPEQRATLMESLPSLPRGDAWVWSPGWPTDQGIFQRVHVDPIETFDSGATPGPGQKRVEPKERADVDLEALRRQMAATVERAKASDPAALRKRIAELERDLFAKGEEAEAYRRRETPAKVERVEVPVLKEADLKRLDAAVDRFRKGGGVLERLLLDLQRKVEAVASVAPRAALGKRADPPKVVGPSSRNIPDFIPSRRAGRPVADFPTSNEAGGALGGGERRVLAAIAQHAEGVTREQLTVLTGYKRSSRDTYLQRLRARGLVADGERLTVTQVGLAELGPDFEPLPTGAALLEHWRGRLPAGERAVLEVAVKAYPEAVDREAITEATGYLRSSRDTYLQRLRSRQLITEPGRGLVRAAEALFS
jgi:hypothetical protein